MHRRTDMLNYEQYLQVCRELQGRCLLLHWIKQFSRTRELHSRIQVKLMQFSLLPRKWHFAKWGNCSTVNPKLLPNALRV